MCVQGFCLPISFHVPLYCTIHLNHRIIQSDLKVCCFPETNWAKKRDTTTRQKSVWEGDICSLLVVPFLLFHFQLAHGSQRWTTERIFPLHRGHRLMALCWAEMDFRHRLIYRYTHMCIYIYIFIYLYNILICIYKEQTASRLWAWSTGRHSYKL